MVIKHLHLLGWRWFGAFGGERIPIGSFQKTKHILKKRDTYLRLFIQHIGKHRHIGMRGIVRGIPIRIPNHRAPNHQLTISWKDIDDKWQIPLILASPKHSRIWVSFRYPSLRHCAIYTTTKHTFCGFSNEIESNFWHNISEEPVCNPVRRLHQSLFFWFPKRGGHFTILPRSSSSAVHLFGWMVVEQIPFHIAVVPWFHDFHLVQLPRRLFISFVVNTYTLEVLNGERNQKKITVFTKRAHHLPTNPTSMTFGFKIFKIPGCSRQSFCGETHSIHIHNYRSGGENFITSMNSASWGVEQQTSNFRRFFFCCFFLWIGPRTKNITNFFLAKSGEVRKGILESKNLHFRERCRGYRLESFLFKKRCQQDWETWKETYPAVN